MLVTPDSVRNVDQELLVDKEEEEEEEEEEEADSSICVVT